MYFGLMELNATARRRWLGALALVAALAMLLGGETVLRGQLGPVQFLVFWLLCLALTATAMLAALVEMRALRERSRQQQRDLFQQTLRDILSDAEFRNRPRPGKSGPNHERPGER